MPPERLLQRSQIPSELPINDFDVVVIDGEPLVVCADFYSALWTWRPSSDAWTERQLPWVDSDEVTELWGDDVPFDRDFQQIGAAVIGDRVLVAAGGQHQGPALWDLESGELHSPPEPWRVAETLEVFGVDGTLHAFTGGASEYLVWDPSNAAEFGETATNLSGTSELSAATVSKVNGRSLVAVGGYDNVVLMDLETVEPLYNLEPVRSFVTGVALTGTMVVAIDRDGVLYRWNLSDGTPLGDPIETGAQALCLAATGTLAITGHDNGTVGLWDLTTGTTAAEPLEDHEAEVNTVVTTTLHTGPAAITGGRDGILRIWDLAM